MNALGIYESEFYELTKVGTDRIRLRLKILNDKTPPRGASLAKALRATYAGGAWYFTPARADKWRLLFLGGFRAQQRIAMGCRIWLFERGGAEMELRNAVNECRKEAAAA